MPHKKLIKSFVYAWAGVIYALRENQNLRIHFFVGIIVCILALYLRISVLEFAVVGLTILLVIASEMINSSIEQMVDLITTEHRKEAQIAKDVAAGMVLVTALGSIVVGILIFAPHILPLLGWY